MLLVSFSSNAPEWTDIPDEDEHGFTGPITSKMNIVSINILAVSSFLILALWAVGLVAQYREKLDREKSSAYECGLDPNKSARIPLSLRFFLLAVIFLVLDVEIALIMAVPIRLKVGLEATVVARRIFMVILILGLVHEWREGSLNWI